MSGISSALGGGKAGGPGTDRPLRQDGYLKNLIRSVPSSPLKERGGGSTIRTVGKRHNIHDTSYQSAGGS